MKTTVTGFIWILLLTSVVGVNLVSLVSASFQYSITSPENTVYPANQVPLNITIRTTNGERFGYSNFVNKIFYCLDGKTNVTLPFTVSQTGDQGIQHYNYRASTLLKGLSDGDHSVKVYAIGSSNYPFVVDTLDFAVGYSSKTTEPNPIPETEFLTITVVASIAIVTMVGLGILTYYKKYKK